MNTQRSASTPRDLALLILRLALGAVFIAHGGQKLFWFGIAGTTEAFVQMGVFLPSVTAPAVSLVEFFGGIALVAGLFTRLASVGIAAVMLGAMIMVHLPAGFFLPNGIEFVLVNFAVAVALVLMGGGRYSVDGRRAAAREEARSAAGPPPVTEPDMSADDEPDASPDGGGLS